MSLTTTAALPTRSEIAARLADPAALARAAATQSDMAGVWDGPIREAAVLIPIVWHDDVPGILLTLRSARLSAHAGQVAFPGGRLEAGETPEAAALREAAEEVGLDPRLPEVIGTLPSHLTGTGFLVTPVVAFLDPPLSLTPEPAEVESIFELPLSVILDPAAPQRGRAELRGRSREFWVWPHEQHYIWGATATMLMTLSQVLRG